MFAAPSFPLMILLHDLRLGLRALARQPLFTAVSVLVLGLGIGANTAVFSVVYTVLLRPLTYPDSERIMFLHERSPQAAPFSVSLPNYLDWQAEQKTFTDLAIVRAGGFNLSFPHGDGREPERVVGAQVSANYVTVLGIPPELGRNFTAAEDTPGGPKVALISDGLWRRRFAANPEALGQPVVVDGVAREIVGVLPRTFRSPRHAEVYLPMGDLRKDAERSAHGFAVAGRLRPGVTLIQARENLDAIARGLEGRYPETNTGWRVMIDRMIDTSVGEYRASLYLLLGAVGCVLLIACANVANLQLARAVARTKELAVRAALGAGRGRLVRQLLTESAVLGVLGGALGLLLALWALDAIVAVGPTDVPRFEDLRLDWQSLLFAGAVAVGSGLLVGAWPASRVTRMAALANTLREGSARGGSAGAAQGRARAWLVVAQIALTVVLLAGAGLTLKSFWRMQNEPFGFRRDGILTMAVSLPEAHYDQEKSNLFFEQLLTRVRALPGVEAAAAAFNTPYDDESYLVYTHIAGTPLAVPGQEPVTAQTFATPEYFKVLGMPMLRGRAFGAGDRAGQPPVLIVDETFAQKFFPGQDPIGKRVDDGDGTVKNAPPLTIVGVVAHTRNEPPGDSPYGIGLPRKYVSAAQNDVSRRVLLVRTVSGDPLALAGPVRRAVLSLDPEVPVSRIATMEQNIAAQFSAQRLTLILLVSFAVLALILASLGLYGVMALGVAQRTRELGIRLALGAQRASVLRLVLGQSARLVGIGLALGLAAALGAGRVLASILYGVSTADAGILLLVALVLGSVGMLASYLPARRATRIDPLTALREE